VPAALRKRGGDKAGHGPHRHQRTPMTATAALSDLQRQARDEAFSLPLDQIDITKPRLFQNDTVGHYFERLRRDAPVHWHHNNFYGGFWSVTRYADIMAVDTNHAVYSSDWTQGGIAIFNAPPGEQMPMFIAMDPPKHDDQRKAVSPIVAPGNLAQMEVIIRERTARVLDSLPRNEPFDWVQRVSIELTTQMLATLFDFPFEDRHKLTRWSDVSTSIPGTDKIVEQQIPMRRLGEPEEVAKAIYFLCTEQSSYVNGAELHINGGQHV